jgi:hypothetical protein
MANAKKEVERVAKKAKKEEDKAKEETKAKREQLGPDQPRKLVLVISKLLKNHSLKQQATTHGVHSK